MQYCGSVLYRCSQLVLCTVYEDYNSQRPVHSTLYSVHVVSYVKYSTAQYSTVQQFTVSPTVQIYC